MYTIKCLAVNFEMSKSHKRVIKKFNKFVMFGKKAGLVDDADAGVEIKKVFREDDKPHEDVDQERGREIEEKVLGKNLNFQCDDINKNCDETDEARHGNVETVDSTSEKTEKLPSSHTKINKFHLKPGKNGKVHIPCVEKPHHSLFLRRGTRSAKAQGEEGKSIAAGKKAAEIGREGHGQ